MVWTPLAFLVDLLTVMHCVAAGNDDIECNLAGSGLVLVLLLSLPNCPHFLPQSKRWFNYVTDISGKAV